MTTQTAPSPTDQSAYVGQTETGVVRVFLVSDELRAELDQSGTTDAFCRALGLSQIDNAHIQQVQTKVLQDTTLQAFLRDGYDISNEDLQDHAFALDGADDADVLVLIVRSPAFLDRPVTLPLDGQAQLIATLREPGANITFEPLPNPDPDAVLEDTPQKKRPSDAAMSGRIATVALLVMALLVWLMIWIAG